MLCTKVTFDWCLGVGKYVDTYCGHPLQEPSRCARSKRGPLRTGLFPSLAADKIPTTSRHRRHAGTLAGSVLKLEWRVYLKGA